MIQQWQSAYSACLNIKESGRQTVTGENRAGNKEKVQNYS